MTTIEMFKQSIKILEGAGAKETEELIESYKEAIDALEIQASILKLLSIYEIKFEMNKSLLDMGSHTYRQGMLLGEQSIWDTVIINLQDALREHEGSRIGIDKHELEKEYEEYWKSKGECLGYVPKECSNCGRWRVEKYANRELICEKCNWNETTKQYEKTYT